MRNEEPNPASAKEQAEGSRENVNVEGAPAKTSAGGAKSKKELDGKNDSGPEPEVHGQEIPPQDRR